jgi:hypothetical protein
MRRADFLRYLSRVRLKGSRLLAQMARIGIALSLLLSLFSVHFALARADAATPPGITSCVVDLEHPCDLLAVEHATHLAGHLTFIEGAAAFAITTVDATRTRQPIRADSLPLSITLPAPAEPPRA